jgi:hypothetical protein
MNLIEATASIPESLVQNCAPSRSVTDEPD